MTRPRLCWSRSGSTDEAHAVAGTLSYGNQKQLELGIALASDPALLLLDEPTAGMSAAETHETMQLLQRVAGERELTLLFTEHDMEVVFSIAAKIAVLHQGRLLAEGTPAEVRRDPEVRRVYLGRARDDGVAGGRGDPHRLWLEPGAVRHLARGRGRRMRLPARAATASARRRRCARSWG